MVLAYYLLAIQAEFSVAESGKRVPIILDQRESAYLLVVVPCHNDFTVK